MGEAANEHLNMDKDELGNPSDNNMHHPFGYQAADDGTTPAKIVGEDMQWFPGQLPPAIETNIDGLSAPPTEVDGDIYTIVTALLDLDVDSIVWQSGTTVRVFFNGTPNLSGVGAGDFYLTKNNGNATNDGTFVISAVDDGADWVEITNDQRTDGTDDESSDAVGTGTITHADWDGADHNDYVKYNAQADAWRSLSPSAGNLTYDETNLVVKFFNGSIWGDVPTSAVDLVSREMKFSYANGAATVAASGYTALARFDFPGSTAVGTPASIKVIAFTSSTDFDLRIQDITNATTIAEVIDQVNPDPSIIDMGALSNVDTSPAIWEIQMLRTGGGTAELNAASIKFA